MLRRFSLHSNLLVKRFQCAHHKLPINRPIATNFHSNICKMSGKTGELVIGTHNGVFHCDEILACYMLQQLPKYENASIIRSRDTATLDACDIVVDVGSVYEPERFRFDHHQKSFQHTFSSVHPDFASKYDKVRLSSAGLIYAHFGEEVIQAVMKRLRGEQLNAECLRNVYIKVYENFIQEIDGIDNGVPQFPGEPTYRIGTHLSARVGHFNSQWNAIEGEFDEKVQFEKAKQLTGAEFVDAVLFYATVWWPARAVVRNAIENRLDTHESGKIIELKEMCPWKQHLYDLEAELQCQGDILYCLYEGSANDHRVICVPNTASSFVCRKFLAAPWRGIRDEELSTVSGIPDARFVHATGFIGGAKSRDGALQMAIESLNSTEEETK